jgi:predicted MFS family arabinose efflux permease
MSSVGAMACFIVSAASYVPFIGVALWILPRWTPPQSSGVAPGRLHPLAGLGEVLRQRSLRGALLTVLATSVLCSPLVTFTPILVREIFHGNAGRFSIAVAAFGAGGLLGATGLLGVASSVNRRVLSSCFAVAYGAVLVLTALTPWFWALPPLLMLAGASMTVSNTSANTLLQGSAGAHLGQTVSLYMLAVRGGSSIGALLTGAEIGLLGVRHAFLVNGVAALVVQAVIARTWRQS